MVMAAIPYVDINQEFLLECYYPSGNDFDFDNSLHHLVVLAIFSKVIIIPMIAQTVNIGRKSRESCLLCFLFVDCIQESCLLSSSLVGLNQDLWEAFNGLDCLFKSFEW